jgi:hypothetical protein
LLLRSSRPSQGESFDPFDIVECNLISDAIVEHRVADAGSTARKAGELGVRTITEAEWRDLAGLG